MTPRATHRGRALLAAGGFALLVAAGLGAPVAAAFGSAVLVWVAAAYLATIPESRRIRGEAVEFAWWVEADGADARGPLTAGRPFRIRAYVRSFAERRLRVVRLVPMTDAVRLPDGHVPPFEVPARARVDVECVGVCRAPGRHALHGVHLAFAGPLGLFETTLYFPSRLLLTFLPRPEVVDVGGRARDEATATSRRTQRLVRDEGTDLHELRELRPGDPFKRIAWKTSARLGRLVVRELEREELGSVHLVLDASATLRDGVPGDRKLDRAVAAVLGLAEASLARGERVGLQVVDRRILRTVDADARADQRARLREALLEAYACVDGDRTVETDAQAATTVARYVKFQEGRDHLDPSVRDGVHVERLALHLLPRARGHHEVRADSAAGRIIRRYAALVGIELTPRSDRDPRRRTASVASALSAAAGRRAGPSRVVLVTDGVDLDFEVGLAGVFSRLRRHGHAVAVVLVGSSLPLARELGLSADDPVVQAHGASDLAHRRAIRARLGARGVPCSLPRATPRGAA